MRLRAYYISIFICIIMKCRNSIFDIRFYFLYDCISPLTRILRFTAYITRTQSTYNLRCTLPNNVLCTSYDVL